VFERRNYLDGAARVLVVDDVTDGARTRQVVARDSRLTRNTNVYNHNIQSERLVSYSNDNVKLGLYILYLIFY